MVEQTTSFESRQLDSRVYVSIQGQLKRRYNHDIQLKSKQVSKILLISERTNSFYNGSKRIKVPRFYNQIRKASHKTSKTVLYPQPNYQLHSTKHSLLFYGQECFTLLSAFLAGKSCEMDETKTHKGRENLYGWASWDTHEISKSFTIFLIRVIMLLYSVSLHKRMKTKWQILSGQSSGFWWEQWFLIMSSSAWWNCIKQPTV